MADEPSFGPVKRYEMIAKQIEREDGLYQLRLNSCVVLNLALGAAAASQLKATGGFGISVTLFLACCVLGISMTVTINSYMRAGRLQLHILREEFRRLKTEHGDIAFPPPFYDDQVPRRRIVPESWSRIPFLIWLTWIGATLTGPAVMYARPQV